MTDERTGFLPFDQGGERAVVIGPLPVELAILIRRSFDELTVVDWIPKRLERLRQRIGSSDKAIRMVEMRIGRPALPTERFDLAMTLFAQTYLGDPEHWLSLLTDRLRSRGRLAIIGRVDRQSLPEQQLTAELLDLQLELSTVKGEYVHPTSDPNDLMKLLRTGSLNHIRQRVFTDPDLLIPTDYWLEEAERILTDVEHLIPTAETSLADEWCEQTAKLHTRLSKVQAQTPPFVMLTAVKRSAYQPNTPIRSNCPSLSIKPDEPEQNSHVENETSVSERFEEPKDKDGSDSDIYKRMLLYGPDGLKNQELLILSLQMLTDEKAQSLNIETLSQRIIYEYGAKAVCEERSPSRLADMLGISQALACRIVAIFEMGRRFFEEPLTRTPVIRDAEDAYPYLRDMGSLKREHLRGLYLNIKNRLIHDEIISIGTLGGTPIHPREVFAPALEYAAYTVILAHNHPSGDLNPSHTDILVTKQLAQAGRIMGIELFDHLIIGSGGFTSMKKRKII
ncbi:MAG: DNA repair protein RadC [Candidatus Electryoneaceae bacterium]|nr:DNA repair protein RadC [Candidatus Electryoneaceae bacterium]